MSEERVKPTPERMRKAGVEHEEITLGDKKKGTDWIALRMLDCYVLNALVKNGSITGDQYNAGMHYFEDWYSSGLSSSGIADLQRPKVDNSPKSDPVHRMDAATRYKKATRALGPVAGHPVTTIVLLGVSLVAYGRKYFGYRKEDDARIASCAVLIRGLDILVRHYYGRRDRSNHVEHYADDYRPEIPPRRA